MRAGVMGAVLVVLVVASAGAGYLIGTNNHSTSTFTSISISTLTSILTSPHTSSQTVFAPITTTVNTGTSTTILATPIPGSSVETAAVFQGGCAYTIADNPNINRTRAPGGHNRLA